MYSRPHSFSNFPFGPNEEFGVDVPCWVKDAVGAAELYPMLGRFNSILLRSDVGSEECKVVNVNSHGSEVHLLFLGIGVVFDGKSFE